MTWVTSPDIKTFLFPKVFLTWKESIVQPQSPLSVVIAVLYSGYFPYNSYLQAGKIYSWCSCGLSGTNPTCDGTCNGNVTRCRPVTFNVSESGYYKLCNCKNSANAPFCNGTHRDLIRAYHKSHRGFYEIWGEIVFYLGFVYMYWNWYTWLIS